MKNNSDYISVKVKKSRLEGEVTISGAKNSALKLITASLLTKDEVKINNIPIDILDVKTKIDMIKKIGKSVDINEESLNITEDKIKSELNWEGRNIRTNLLILGALLTRTGKAKVPKPGGCKIGKGRPYDLHTMVIKSFGARFWEDDQYLYAESKDKLKGTEIHLPIRSTGATENSILMATLAKGKTKIWNPHIRPEIIDLITMLNKMGAKINVNGQESIDINGVDKLKGVEHNCIPDNMEALTFLIGAAITNGDVKLKNFPLKHLEIPMIHLREAGLKYYISENKNEIITRDPKIYPIDIATGPYPSINSDMQPILSVWALNAKSKSKIIDLRFPGRYKYTEELKKMGGNFNINGDILEIEPSKLNGTKVFANDLRAGASLILAGICAEGATIIDNFNQVQRGYNSFIEKLKKLKANINFYNDK